MQIPKTPMSTRLGYLILSMWGICLILEFFCLDPFSDFYLACKGQGMR